MLPGFELQSFVREWGPTIAYIVLFAIIFAESGLLIGFFLPGDSLLFSVGVVAALGYLNIAIVIPLLAIAAVAGDSVGYAFGRRVGPRLFQRDDSIWFHRKHLARAQEFYEKHGGKTIILARFVPIVRTFAPIVAGMGEMAYQRFILFNVVGGLLWTVGVALGGLLFGSMLPAEQVDRYLLPVIALIVIVSIAPTVLHLYKENRAAVHRIVRERRLGS